MSRNRWRLVDGYLVREDIPPERCALPLTPRTPTEEFLVERIVELLNVADGVCRRDLAEWAEREAAA